MLDLSGLLDLFFAIDETDKTIRAKSSSYLIGSSQGQKQKAKLVIRKSYRFKTSAMLKMSL
jgi:hypothetical protein